MRLLADFILVFGFAITSVILFMLFTTKNRQLPQKILLVLLGFIWITIVSFYAELHHLKLLHRLTFVFENAERMIMGPLLYIYVKSLFVENKGLVRRHRLHFIPFLLYWIVFTVPFAVSWHRDDLLFNYLKPFVGTPYMALFKDTCLLVYIIMSIRLFGSFRTMMKRNYSGMAVVNIEWLKKFLFSFFGVILFDFAITLWELLFGYFTTWDTGYITAVVMIVLVTYLGYHGIKQSVVAMPEFLIKEGFSSLEKQKMALSTEISDRELTEIQLKLESAMRLEKPYLSQELALTHLAKSIGTTDKKLSLVLNRKMKVSFYDYINGHRVATVKDKLSDAQYDHFSLMGIAYDSGFKSKSSFYRIFKKETGVSPSQYKQKRIARTSPSASAET